MVELKRSRLRAPGLALWAFGVGAHEASDCLCPFERREGEAPN